MLPQMVPATDRECLVQLYAAVGEMQRDVGQVKAMIAILTDRRDKEDERIRRLETWQARIIGGAIVVSAVVSLAITLGLALLKL